MRNRANKQDLENPCADRQSKASPTDDRDTFIQDSYQAQVRCSVDHGLLFWCKNRATSNKRHRYKEQQEATMGIDCGQDTL